jgi:hypothetical protein
VTAAVAHRYAIDGLRVETPVAVAGLDEVPEADWASDWVVEVSPGRIEPDEGDVTWTGQVEGPGGRWARFGRTARGVRVHLEGLCALAADRDARRAVIHAEREAATETYLLRRCLPYLVALGGRVAIHASCAAFARGAVAFCGPAGAGKSTLAMALDAAGVPVLADDHVAIDVPPAGTPVAFPSFPSVEVDRTSRLAFRPDAPDADGKARVALTTARPRDAVPLAALAFLERGRSFRSSRLAAKAVVPRLLRDAALVADPGDPSESAARFDAVVRLAEAVPSFAVVVPDGLDRLRESVPRLFERFGGSPR